MSDSTPPTLSLEQAVAQLIDDFCAWLQIIKLGRGQQIFFDDADRISEHIRKQVIDLTTRHKEGAVTPDFEAWRQHYCPDSDREGDCRAAWEAACHATAQRCVEIAYSFERKKVDCDCAAVDIGVGIQHEPTCGFPRPLDVASAIRTEFGLTETP